MTGDELRAIIRDELQPIHRRLDVLGRKVDEASEERKALRSALEAATGERKALRVALDHASEEREVMWHAFLAPVRVEPGQTLAEAVAARKSSGRKRRGGRIPDALPQAASAEK
ncbi:MAG: hypothetical protein OXI65_08155 [Acidobacteriota bacterium]|nr:hypothetical protein [Acidobacteriota bacterium]